MSDDAPSLAPATLVARGEPQAGSGAVIPPLQLSSTYARASDYTLLNPDHAYGRDQNPTFDAPERLLAQLEDGFEALLFPSGMSAAMSIVQALQPGDELFVPRSMYWGLRNWLEKFCATWGLRLTFIEGNTPDQFNQALAAALASPAPATAATRLVWLESPANPTWNIIDLQAACQLAHAGNAQVAVDSTVATPVHTQPLTLGADLVMHSATKYLNGHSDVVAGALVCAEPTPLWKRIRRIRSEQGAILGPFEAWLLHRGMRTLFLRVARSSATALTIAQHFDGHPAVARVLYPGLPGHPGHAVAARQMRDGFGGMLSLCVHGGARAALRAAGRCRVFVRATSLGGVESLVEHRHSIEGAASSIPPELLRLSVGIEDPQDLIADLEQALAGA